MKVAANSADRDDVGEQRYRVTLGHHTQSGPWTDVRALSWDDLTALLTSHEVGPKDGACIVPATFRGSHRHKVDAAQIDIAVLDSDTGTTLTEILDAVARQGWSAIVSSTHSHLTTRTRVGRVAWDRFCAGGQAGGAEAFLLQEKGYLPRIAAGARVAQEGPDHVILEHQPCPKFRVVIPLLRPWRAMDYPDQDLANGVWAERVPALAAALDLAHDQSCTDTSRLFYLPRRPAGGPTPETAVLEGAPCDIFALEAAGPVVRTSLASDLAEPAEQAFTDSATGEVVDLTAWARGHAARFQIVAALKSRRPDIFVGKVSGGIKHHLRCANEDEHTNAGADHATIAINASDSRTRGFVCHCRHAHCTGRDRLFFVRRMLEQQWLTIGDLTDPAFLMDEDASAQEGDEAELTEHSAALAFTRRHQQNLRYCHTTGAWFVWDGTRWAKNETRLAFNWARQLVAELSAGAPTKTRVTTGKAAFAGAVERFAQADEALAVTSAIWDCDPWLLSTPAGTVDLRTGLLRAAEPDDHITRCTAIAPSATAACPVWLSFLGDAAGQDQDLISFLQRWFGYCLTGVTREHALLFVYGPGGNGKGVLLTTMAGILGAYATTAAMDTFTASQGERHPTDLAMLHGARLVMTTETEEGRAWAEARIKALTGGDPITARFMRRDFFTFQPAFKLTISGNHKPTLRNVDDAARRRFNVVPFLNKPAAPKLDLVETLQTEWPGILRWMIDGCLAWQNQGLDRPRAVLDATAEYFAEQDVLAQWVEECCEQGTGIGDTSANLFASWRGFAQRRAEEVRNAKWFGTMLERQGFRREKDGRYFRGRGFVGIRVKPEPVEPHWQERDQ